MALILRTGVDLVEISRFDQIDAAIRERFCRRVFTPEELDDSAGNYASLAGRFAVKEAVAKALGCGLGALHWQDIETRRGPSGEPALVLSGEAWRLAEQKGLTTWSISIIHSRSHAVAVAVGEGSGAV